MITPTQLKEIARKIEHHSILRGKDLQTREFSPERRDAQFAVLKEAQSYALNLQNWHDFSKFSCTLVIRVINSSHPRWL